MYIILSTKTDQIGNKLLERERDMSKPDNKYCVKCTKFDDSTMSFFNKYGYTGCIGIFKASGEFPYNTKLFCFDDKPIKTEEEKYKDKINLIISIIRDNSTKKAAKIISRRFK